LVSVLSLSSLYDIVRRRRHRRAASRAMILLRGSFTPDRKRPPTFVAPRRKP